MKVFSISDLHLDSCLATGICDVASLILKIKRRKRSEYIFN